MNYKGSFVVKFLQTVWRKARLVFQDFDKTAPILIYQMGKVGSSSVYNSLKRAGIANPLYHVHFLSYSNLDDVERYHRSVGAIKPIAALKLWRTLRRKLDGTNGPIYVISLVREPVAREISDVFQNMKIHHAELLTDSDDVDVDKVIARIRNNFSNFDESTDYTCAWFDKEIRDTFGIDVLASDFDQSRGFSNITLDHIKLLLLRMEDLSEMFETAMLEFMGLSIPMIRANESSSKQHFEAYKSLLEKFALPESTGSKILNSRYARHFYPQAARNELREKWMQANQQEQTG